MAKKTKKLSQPKWLKPGALVWCGFTGIVTDIAAGETAIMVQVESPKRLALGQRPEWLEYRPGVALTLDEAIERVLHIAEAGRSVRQDILVICHGGPFDEPDQVGKALRRMPGIQGFFGASSIERLPTERAIRGQVQEFKGLKLAQV